MVRITDMDIKGKKQLFFPALQYLLQVPSDTLDKNLPKYHHLKF